MSGDLAPVYARPLETPTGQWSRPVFFSNGAVKLFVFHDDRVFCAFALDGQRAWQIKARSTIRGWTFNQNDLYIQDGDVLCRYDSTFTSFEFPLDAVSLRHSPPKMWSSASEDKGAGFEALFEPAAPAAPECSAPVHTAADNRVHVLRRDGTVYSVLLDLEVPFGAVQIKATGLVADEPTLYIEPVAGGASRLCWTSGGKVAVLATGQLETPAAGLDAWRWTCVRASSDQPSLAWGAAPGLHGFIASLVYDSTLAAALTLFDPSSKQWTFHLVDPPGFPLFNGGGSLSVHDAASNRTVTHGNGAIPGGLAATFPHDNARELAGTLLPHTAGDVFDIPAAPCLQRETDGWFIYLIASTGEQHAFCKYRAPTAGGAWVMAWWKAAGAAYQAAERALSSEIIVSLDDPVQAAIGRKVLPAGFAASTYVSPLWTATAQGLVPWDRLGFSVTSNYMTLNTLAAFATAINTNYQFPRQIDFVSNASRFPKPNMPLSGPVRFSSAQAEYLIVSNDFGIYGFTPAGALSWQIMARKRFRGWVTAGRYLFAVESCVLSQYDIAAIANRGVALYPDAWVDLSNSQEFPVNVDRSSQFFFDSQIGNFPDDALAMISGPVHDTDSNAIHVGIAGSNIVVSVGLDASGAIVAKSLLARTVVPSWPGDEATLYWDRYAGGAHKTCWLANAQFNGPPVIAFIKAPYSHGNVYPPGDNWSLTRISRQQWARYAGSTLPLSWVWANYRGAPPDIEAWKLSCTWSLCEQPALAFGQSGQFNTPHGFITHSSLSGNAVVTFYNPAIGQWRCATNIGASWNGIPGATSGRVVITSGGQQQAFPVTHSLFSGDVACTDPAAHITALRMNTADGAAVDICGTPYVAGEGSSWFLYICLAKSGQYVFAKYAVEKP